jgi:hypothetical protein
MAAIAAIIADPDAAVIASLQQWLQWEQCGTSALWTRCAMAAPPTNLQRVAAIAMEVVQSNVRGSDRQQQVGWVGLTILHGMANGAWMVLPLGDVAKMQCPEAAVHYARGREAAVLGMPFVDLAMKFGAAFIAMSYRNMSPPIFIPHAAGGGEVTLAFGGTPPP